MKNTTKIVLGIVGALVIIVIALAIGARVFVDNILSSAGEGDAIELSGTYGGGRPGAVARLPAGGRSGVAPPPAGTRAFSA